jgi:RHS repeat-associated protein
VLNKTGSTLNDFLYAGEQFDPNVGFYYLRARYYDPTSGRFISRDPFGGNPFEPQSLHKYAYAHNDPINRRDPSGMFSLAEMDATMEMSMVLDEIFPQLLKGLNFALGIDVFYRPGFGMRNFGVEMLSFCVSDGCFASAIKLIESGNKLIVMGSHMMSMVDEMIGTAWEVKDLLMAGYGFYEMAEAIRNAPAGYRYISVSIDVFEQLEYLEVRGQTLLKVTATTTKGGSFVHFESWKDYTEAINKALKALIDLVKGLKPEPHEE